MKKSNFLYFLFILIIHCQLSFINCKAQPNGGFENWSTVYNIQEPDNWQTLNFISADPQNPLSAFKATGIDKHSGNYALKLKTVYFSNNPFPEEIGDSTGGIFTGKFTFSPFAYKYGFPYTGRPEKLEFWSKYFPVGADTAGAIVILKKWTGTESDTIAIGGININAIAGYNLFTVDLVYYSTEQPDSALVGFAASKVPEIARINSTLYVDDVVFSGWVGIEQFDKETEAVQLFPNPVKDNMTIVTKIEDAENVQLIDVSGKLIGVYKIQNYNTIINTVLFPTGIYFYEIRDKKNKILTKDKFNVVK